MPTQRLSPIGTGVLPGRKNPCLFETDKETGKIIVLATFRGEEMRQRFLAHQPRINQADVGGADE